MPLDTVTVTCPHCNQKHPFTIPTPTAPNPLTRDVRLMKELLGIFRERDQFAEIAYTIAKLNLDPSWDILQTPGTNYAEKIKFLQSEAHRLVLEIEAAR